MGIGRGGLRPRRALGQNFVADANTVRRIAATLAAIYLTYGVIQARGLQTIFLVYPELLLVILGLLVAVGRYTGYRLSELIRFRALAATTPPATPPE